MRYISVIMLFIITTALYAQKEFTLSGKIVNENGESASASTVMLKNLPDSSLVKGIVSDNSGNFKFSAPAGDYFLEITFISYNKKIVPVKGFNSNRNIGTIELEPSSVMTEDVIVEAEKEYMQFDLDKRVFNVNKDPRNVGKNASEILDNIPSVTVDVEGNISLRGSEDVKILVDGKPSSLIGRDPEALRQLMGDMIDKVEVITNPSAKQDAQGEVGIINIVLKKNERQGINAGLELNTGMPDNHGISGNANYRYDFINFFGSLGLSYRRNPGTMDAFQTYFNNPNLAYTETNRDMTRGGFGSNIRLGTDIYFNDHNILTFASMYRFGTRMNETEITYKDFLANNEMLGIQNRLDDEGEEKNDVEFELSYKLMFDDEDHVLLFNSKFIQDKDLEESDITHNNYNYDNTNLFQESSNLEFERNQLYQLDYTFPFSKDGKFEAGAKSNLRKIDNDYWVQERTDQTEWNYLDDYNNNFLYYENIYAAYAMLGNKISNFGWQLGLRTEYSDITTELVDSDYYNNRDYMDFFPTLHLTYKLSDGHSLQASYARRINRPYFRHLMPFSNFSDNRNLWGGNPDLDPEYTDSYETGYIMNLAKFSLLSSAYYRFSRGVIQRVTYIDEEGTTRISPYNIGTEESFGGEFNLSYDPFEWLTLSNNLNIYRSIIDGNTNVEDLNSDNWTWTNRITSKMKAIYGINVQLTLDYRAPREVPQGKIKEMWYLDFGLSKDFYNNKMTITVSGNDIFDTRRRRMTTYGDDFIFNQNFNWHSGNVVVSFSYRFNQAKKPQKPMGGGDEM